MSDNKTYRAEYTCLNCGTKLLVDVDFGRSMPLLIDNENSDTIKKGYGFLAPECSYCGCRSYSHGKKPEKKYWEK